MIILWLLLVIIFIVMATAKLKWHPFIVLLLACFITAFLYQIPLPAIAKTISTGFGNILGSIGLVIVLGTIIGLILEKTGAAVVMAESVVKAIGPRFPTLAMSIVGAIVSVPVFCDSGFVILHSLKTSLSTRMKVSPVAMSVALATGLYATHTFVPPTSGPIAAAGNLNLGNQLGLVIGVGLFTAIVPIVAGWLWANRFLHEQPDNLSQNPHDEAKSQIIREAYGALLSPVQAFMPIVVPILLICLGSIAAFPTHPFGEGLLATVCIFLGTPLNALLIGLFLSLTLIRGADKTGRISQIITDGLSVSAPILLITGAGGAFGAILKETPVSDYLGQTLSNSGIGIFMPFIVAAALKSAQGSTTVALVTTSSIVAPLLAQIGLDSEMGRVLCVMAIGAGAMTVSHANDSFFWVVTQFSRMSVGQGYRTLTTATAIQGISAIIWIWLLGWIFL
ncbi:MAG: GntP family permease [Cardiobacteriaceae bacterium]|nr:GntP family permease [Cardiobacteriaceae bacterium]